MNTACTLHVHCMYTACRIRVKYRLRLRLTVRIGVVEYRIGGVDYGHLGVRGFQLEFHGSIWL